MSLFIALDPGLVSGAWAAIDHNGAYVACGDIPHANDRVQPRALRIALEQAIPKGDSCEIAIENVFGMPGQGISSTSKFMRAAGCIEAVALMMHYPVHFVRPQEWKKYHNLIGTTKKESLALAREKWPTAPLKLAKHHGRADALLMADWLRDTLY